MNTINARIPEDLDNSLSLLARLMERSKSYIISKAIECYVREQLEDIDDADIALRRAMMTDKTLYTSEEVQKILETKLNV